MSSAISGWVTSAYCGWCWARGLTAVSFAGDEGPKVSIWLWVGAACYALYRFRTTRFIIVPTDKGNLCVIDDDDGKRILDEIGSRRAMQYRVWRGCGVQAE